MGNFCEDLEATIGESRGEGVVKFVLAKIFGWKPPLWLAFVFKKLKYVKKPN